MKVRQHTRQNADGTRSLVQEHDRTDRLAASQDDYIPTSPQEMDGFLGHEPVDLDEASTTLHEDDPITSGRAEEEPIRHNINKSKADDPQVKLLNEMEASAWESKEEWKARIDLTASRRYQYSPRNQGEIMWQLTTQRDENLPQATGIVLSKTKWEALGGKLRDDHQRLVVLRPRGSGRVLEVDEETGEEVERHYRVRKFANAYAYDLADVEGVPMNVVIANADVRGTPEAAAKARQDLEEVADKMGIRVRTDNFAAFAGRGTAQGFYSFADKTLCVRPGLSDAETAAVMAHELGHACDPNLRDAGKKSLDPAEQDKARMEYYQANRDTCEMVAESVAYGIMKQYDLDSSNFSYHYIEAWLPKTSRQGKNVRQRFDASLGQIQSLAGLVETHNSDDDES